MPSTDRKLELKAKTSVAQTASQSAVYAKGLTLKNSTCCSLCVECFVRISEQTTFAVYVIN
jgi:hypothetical protein